MRHRRGRGLAGALLGPALLLAASAAVAQDVTVYDNATDYEAAAGAATFCLDFNGSPGAFVSGASFSPSVTFGSPEAADATQVNWSSDAISDAGSTVSADGVGSMDATFAGTATAFQFTFLSNANSATVDLYAEDGTFLAGLPAPNAPGFFGVVSSFPVKRFVITPGLFDPALGPRDRFFIDDFCVHEGPAAPPPPPPADLDDLCADFDAAVAAADPAAFRGRNRQRALANKLRVVCRRVHDGDAASLCAALHKLRNDVLRKMDGDRSPTDWVTDAAVQQALEDQGNALAAAIEEALEALGGCPGDAAHDDDDGEPGSHGRGRGRGHGHGKP